MDNNAGKLISNYHRIRTEKYSLAEKNLQLVQQNQALLDKIALLTNENEAKQKYINDILNSRSWKIINTTRKLTLRKPKQATDNEPNPTKVSIKPKLPKSYSSHYEDNFDFSKYKSDIKPIAFYLPQFHTFPENNKWWGEGFTEWTNTRSATPRFDGHYQPREPHDDFGYYTLDDKGILKKQIRLAKQHGVYGFSFYYYWFSGKKLMEKPLRIFLNNKDLNFPFCLCWANENWTRRWDGKEKDILIAQSYSKNDPINFIKDIKEYLLDPRYIKVDNKPVILVYNPAEIPDFETVVKKWKDTAIKENIGEIEVWAKSNIFNDDYKSDTLLDGEFDFAPNAFNFYDCSISHNASGLLYDYKIIFNKLSSLNIYEDHVYNLTFYYSATMGWDNSARRKDAGYTVFTNYSPKTFYDWLKMIINITRSKNPPDKRFIFINAWNEWAEGTYLEPDKKYGYTNINTLSRAIFDLPYSSERKQK
ncbi:glycoside hydrolase family 99-like domain-containing protein [Candidatus Saccharibacteria bacterium]|nr:glycoside hydrolase family 99-like domain-containing protein [Candidatus Saccharibacteria bacterium]